MYRLRPSCLVAPPSRHRLLPPPHPLPPLDPLLDSTGHCRSSSSPRPLRRWRPTAARRCPRRRHLTVVSRRLCPVPRACGARRLRRRPSVRPHRGLQRRDPDDGGRPRPDDSARAPRPVSPAAVRFELAGPGCDAGWLNGPIHAPRSFYQLGSPIHCTFRVCGSDSIRRLILCTVQIRRLLLVS